MRKLKVPALNRFLVNEERASNVVIFGAAAIGVLCFVAAVCAMHFMK